MKSIIISAIAGATLVAVVALNVNSAAAATHEQFCTTMANVYMKTAELRDSGTEREGIIQFFQDEFKWTAEMGQQITKFVFDDNTFIRPREVGYKAYNLCMGPAT